jgi:hypothetical protein
MQAEAAKDVPEEELNDDPDCKVDDFHEENRGDVALQVIPARRRGGGRVRVGARVSLTCAARRRTHHAAEKYLLCVKR